MEIFFRPKLKLFELLNLMFIFAPVNWLVPIPPALFEQNESNLDGLQRIKHSNVDAKVAKNWPYFLRNPPQYLVGILHGNLGWRRT